jgi:hypothetical protein
MNGASALAVSGDRTGDVRGARTSVAPSAGGRTSDDRGARRRVAPSAGARTSDDRGARRWVSTSAGDRTSHDRGAAQAGLDVGPRHGGRPVSGARARVASLGPLAAP